MAQQSPARKKEKYMSLSPLHVETACPFDLRKLKLSSQSKITCYSSTCIDKNVNLLDSLSNSNQCNALFYHIQME